MSYCGIRGWCLVLGLLGGAGAAGCASESPCEYTATCPPPEGGLDDTDTSDESRGPASDTDDTTEPANSESPSETETYGADQMDTEPAEAGVSVTEPSDTDEQGPAPIPTFTFPPLPVLPVTPVTTDAGTDDVDAAVVVTEVTDQDVIGTEDAGTAATEATEVTEPEETPDYCAEDNGGCDALTTCTNTPAGAECGACPAGYLGNGASGCGPGLLGLGSSHGSVSPAIASGVDSYQLVVPVFIQNLTLTPSALAGATLSIHGASIAPGASWTSPPLNLGLNTISILVEQTGRPSSTYTLNVTRGAEATVYLKASNAEAGDYFGRSVALSGDGSTLAVGAYGEDSSATGVGGNESNNSAADSGAVYVFVRSGNDWVQQAYIKASNAGISGQFGLAVVLSSDGNTLAVGAIGEDSNATGVAGDQDSYAAENSGAVYVFVRSGGSWAQQAYIKASNTEELDSFGRAVALSSDGNTLAVGATGEDSSATGTSGSGQSNNDASDSGAVYIFTRSGSGWTQQAYLKASNTGADDHFGTSLSLSSDGNTLAIGAVGEDSNATGTSGSGQSNNDATGSGAVYVFVRGSSSWTQQAYLKASNTDALDSFGIALSLSGDGNTLAIGAVGEDSNATGTSGSGQSNNDATGSGAVYVFVRGSSSWTQQAYLKASNTGAADGFGRALGLSSTGNTLAVGAYGEGSNATGAFGGNQSNNDATSSGAVYLLIRSGNSWTQQAYLKATHAQSDAFFGESVALSDDGNVLAAGAGGESSNATGVNGTPTNFDSINAGAVYLFR